MKIILTGSSGFLGSIIYSFLKYKNCEILTIGRSEADLRIDISNSFNLDIDFEVETVIHAAGKAHDVPKNKNEINQFFKVNFQGTINLCESLNNLKKLPKQFIFISSVAVYGLEEGINIDESYPLKGVSPYAKSKIEAERYLINWAKINHVVLTILRLPLIAGPNPPGNLGAMIRGIKSGRYLSIGDATAKKSVIWVEDIPKFIFEVNKVGGIYNLTDNYHPSFGELELHISQKLNKPKPKKVPLTIAKLMALLGDLMGEKLPINSNKLKKITSTLTFNSDKARKFPNWKPCQVLDKL